MSASRCSSGTHSWRRPSPLWRPSSSSCHQLELYPALDGGEGFASGSPSGAYNVLDRDNRLIVARERGLGVFGDDGDASSPIELVHRFDLPAEELCRREERDHLVGITMTYDGHVAFATRLGTVGVVPRDPAEMIPENTPTPTGERRRSPMTISSAPSSSATSRKGPSRASSRARTRGW